MGSAVLDDEQRTKTQRSREWDGSRVQTDFHAAAHGNHSAQVHLRLIWLLVDGLLLNDSNLISVLFSLSLSWLESDLI
jgi:hypothetical protein